MKNFTTGMKYLGLATSVFAFSTTAMAQILPVTVDISTLAAGTPSTDSVASDGPNGEISGAPVDINPADPSEGQRITTYTTDTTTTNFTAGGIDTGSFGGQTTNIDATLTATVESVENVPTVTTSVPDGLGGFTVTGPELGDPVPGDTTVSNVSVAYNEATDITGMLEVHVQTDSATGDTAQLSATLGSVTTEATIYQTGTGTATFDPTTGETTSTLDTLTGTSQSASGFEAYNASAEGLELTTVDASGLSTTGTVNANQVNTNGLDVNGGVITNVGDGVAATDAVNVGQLTAETDRATGAEAVLTTAIADETNRATGAEGVLTTAISTEVTNRTAAVTAEATARANADTALSASLTTEHNRATAAEAALGSRVDALSSRVDRFNNELQGGIATAVALSGGTFLPNKKVNVTVNLGGYESKTAIAGQVFFLINDNIALNAGLATGLNGGGTSYRGGVTFGF